jgi:hypothetical protein
MVKNVSVQDRPWKSDAKIIPFTCKVSIHIPEMSTIIPDITRLLSNNLVETVNLP